jgi:hypothetical protein
MDMVRDYSHLWRLPPPLPRRSPVFDVTMLAAVLLEIVAAVLLPELAP